MGKKKSTVVVIGLGVFGVELVKQLKSLNATVIAIDKEVNKVALVGDVADRTFICDSTNISSLEEIGIDKVDHAIVAMGQGNPASAVASITTTLGLKKLGVSDVIVRLDDINYKNVLEEIGATTLFSPLKMASEKLANIVLADNFEDYFNISNEYSVLEVEVSVNAEEIGLVELNAPKKYGVIISLLERDGKVYMPNAEDSIKPGDKIFVFGKKADANKLAARFSK